MEARPLQGKALQAVRYSTAKVNAYEGTVRSSKTFTSLIDWVRYCRNGPPGTLLMTGRTERTVINNLIMPLQELLGENRVKLNRGYGTVTICGRSVLLVGANNEAARTKIQGLTLAGAYVDEASTLPESYFNMLFSRLSVGGSQMWLTSNPEGPAHWLKVNWLDQAKLWIDRDGRLIRNPDGKNYLRVTFKLEDNPNLPADYVEDIKAAYTGLWYRRYILGEWCVAEGAVFPMWDPDRHVVSALPAMRRVLALGVDHGFTNASAGILLGLGVDSRLYAMAEWWDPKTDVTAAEQSQSLRAWLPGPPAPEAVAVDPAAKGFKNQLAHDGLRVVNADNDVPYGLPLIGSLLSEGQLLVHESCTNLILELPGYTWDTKASAKGVDKPKKAADHAIDALRYAVATTEPLWRDMVSGRVFTMDDLDDEIAALGLDDYQ